MKLLVVGAAGKTGRAVVEQALSAGHDVTALVRSAGSPVAGVAVVVGDADDAATARAAVTGQDAVIDTVGGRAPYRRTTLETRVVTALIAAMRQEGVRRLVVTSAIGVGESRSQATYATRLLVATFLRGSTSDKTQLERAVRDSGLDWVITRPAVLTDEAASGSVQVLSGAETGTVRTLTRADLAMFLVAQLTTDQHLHTAVTVANR